MSAAGTAARAHRRRLGPRHLDHRRARRALWLAATGGAATAGGGFLVVAAGSASPPGPWPRTASAVNQADRGHTVVSSAPTALCATWGITPVGAVGVPLARFYLRSSRAWSWPASSARAPGSRTTLQGFGAPPVRGRVRYRLLPGCGSAPRCCVTGFARGVTMSERRRAAAETPEVRRSHRLIVKALAFFALLSASAPGGGLAVGWVFIGPLAAPRSPTLILIPTNPALLAERSGLREEGARAGTGLSPAWQRERCLARGSSRRSTCAMAGRRQ